MSSKVKLATIWLDGCSGCHMSFLDMDERLIELSERIEYVSGPYIDRKFQDYPEDVDICLVEGSVSNEEDLHKVCIIRERSKKIISFGDCAVTGNVSAMRNIFGPKECLAHSYEELSDEDSIKEPIDIPKLLESVHAVHEVIDVDYFLPGCPPPSDAIFYVINEVLEGREPNPSHLTRFGK